MLRRLAIATAALAAALAPLAANATISPDNTYGNGGTATVPLVCAPGTTRDVVPAAGFNGGLFLLAECAHAYDRLIALDSAGNLDPTFGTDGHLVIKFSPTCWGTSVHLNPINTGSGSRGQLMIASEGRTSAGDSHTCIVRVTTTGKLYRDFGQRWTPPGGGQPLSTSFLHLDRVGGGQNRLVGFVGGGGPMEVFTERINSDWHKSAFFVNRYASNGHPYLPFSGDGQRAFVQPYATQMLWGVFGEFAVSVNNGHGLDGTQVFSYDNQGNLDPAFAHDGSRFLSRSDLGGAAMVPGEVAGSVSGGLVFPTLYSGPGKQWIDLDLIGPTGLLRPSFDSATQKISALSATVLNGVRLQVSDGHYALGWKGDNLPHTTGFNPDGTRWTALGTNGTAPVLARQWAPDEAAFYDFQYTGSPITTANVTRSTVQ